MFILIGEIAGDTGTTKLEAELYNKWELMEQVDLPNFINTVYSLTIWTRGTATSKKWPLTCKFCFESPKPSEKFYRDRFCRRILVCPTCMKTKGRIAREEVIETLQKECHITLPPSSSKFNHENKKFFR